MKNENNIDDLYFGEFQLEIDLNEASFGTIQLQGECEIHIYSNEGPISHFHITDKTGKNTLACICLTSARYFDHGKYKGKLTSKQKKKLNNFLRDKPDNFYGLSRWEAMCIGWDTANKNYQIKNAPKNQPFYTQMTDTITN